MSELLKINVNQHTESKNGLTYLSWAWAWSEVLKIDPQATWEAAEFNGMPACFMPDGSAMVKTSVSIKGHTKTCWLPVMNHKNQAIKGPDAFQINTAIVRCLTKTISMHGLGLYIYAGEDLPPLDTEALDQFAAELAQLEAEGNTMEAVREWYANEHVRTSNDAREYLWKQLRDHSALRAAIKANKPELQAA
ncbi:DUF1071 domain-containing protein [Hydrogenophaga crocea]|uniref:DUF1071 domain-containing protein n=1 Tax=Hydrogenophaga crocea TaxID=2716225 RepID=A0A6G8IEP8_9BURK|nr:DUF1071 domain-containing protein [Hydrogenophaga crocea]QIM51589.1 DUF1071 domain-containing protein [Hydrogenophaga crocea]